MSINWLSDAEPRPAILVLPPAAVSLDEAYAAIELWEHYSGKTLDKAQRLAVEVMMAQTADGRWAAATTGREEPRQNGKGDEVEVVELWDLVQRSAAILHTVHDAVLLASQAQERMLGVLEAHADLRRLVKRKWRGTGQQMIEMRNGGIIWYRTRTGGGGRGVDDVDRLVVDEAQHAQREHLAALTPTLFANRNPQTNALGSAGIEGKSDWWWEVRTRALGPDPGDFGYVGHTAENVYLDETGRPVQEPVDVEDRALWLGANPALHAGRGQGFPFFEEQLRRLGPRSFANEHLCVWDSPPNGGVDGFRVIPQGAWSVCEDVLHTPSGPVIFALDVDTNARGEEWCSIATSDGVHLEDVTPANAGPGTAWVVPAAVKQKDRIGALLIDPSGPARKLIAPLEQAGIELRKLKVSEVSAASMHLVDRVALGQVRHIAQSRLTRAVAGVARRDVGDGAYKFSRTYSADDISPLMAASFACWGSQLEGGPSVYEERGLASL